MEKPLCALSPGEVGVIVRCSSTHSIRRRLIDLGFCEGERIECLYLGILRGPIAYRVQGAVVALRRELGRQIVVAIE